MDIVNIFQTTSVLDFMIINFGMQLHTNMLCKRLRFYEWLNQKRLGVHLLFLSKNNISSVLKILVANFIA